MLPSGILSHIGSPISLIKGRQTSFSREGTGAAEATALFRRLEAVVTAAFELCGFGEDKWRESQASLGEFGIRAGHARVGQPVIRSGSGNRAATFAIRLPAVQMARQAVRQSEPGNEKLSDINPITCYAHSLSLLSSVALCYCLPAFVAFPLSFPPSLLSDV